MPGRRARQRAGRAHHEPAEVHRVQAVDVLVGVDGEQSGFLVEAAGKRELDQIGVHRGSALKRAITASSSSWLTSAGRCSWNEAMPTSAQSACFRAT